MFYFGVLGLVIAILLYDLTLFDFVFSGYFVLGEYWTVIHQYFTYQVGTTLPYLGVYRVVQA